MAHHLVRMSAARTVARHLAGVLALGLVTVFLAWVPASPAAAHGALVSSDPPEDGVLAALPSRAFLTFSDSITEVREIAVSGPDGSVTNGEPTFAGAEVQQTLWAGPAGDYTLEYFVVSADGHDVRGLVRFEVDEALTGESTGGAGQEAEASDVAPAAVRTDDGTDRVRTAVLPAALVVLAAAVALLLLRRRRSSVGGNG